jgi:UDP-2-acetamido-2-deoxy-ribo-hexuluronate aminotransferase
MEFRDLKSQYKELKTSIDSAIAEVLRDSNYIMGNQVYEIEKILSEYIGVRHCITCGNGTDALNMVLMAWGVHEGHAVFVPNFTFFATAEVVAFAGATPVFVDIDMDTFNIDPLKLEASIKKVAAEGKYIPKAIIAVDLFGLPANYIKIEMVAKKYGLLLLEDGAQGFGGQIGNKRACSFGDISTTSFFPAKPLGCYGDGGAIFTNDDDTAEYLKSIRIHGKGLNKYDNVRIGLNSRLDTLQAAILKEKFKAFEKYELEAVNKVADIYTWELRDVVKTPIVPEGYYSSWAQYTIKLESMEQREMLEKKLKEKNIPTMIYYKTPLHMQKAFVDLGYKKGDFPVSEELADTVLSLPIHPYLQQADIEYICKEIKSAI